MAWGSGGPEDAAIEAAIEAAVEAEAEAEAEVEAEVGGGIASGRDIRGDWGRTRSSQGIPGGGHRQGYGGNRWGRTSSDPMGNRFGDDITDGSVTGSSAGLLDADFHSDFALGGTAPSYSGPSLQADIVNQEGRLDRWGNAINRFFGMPQDVISQIDTFTEIDPTTGNVHHSDGRITDGTTGETIQEPTRDWREPWYMDPNREGYDGEEDRDDSPAIYACEAAGGTWDGGQCNMPEDDDDDDDDNGDDEFGDPNPFVSLTRKRQMWYHPMLGGTGHGQVYDPYSGTRPIHVDANLWDYMAPRGGAELSNWSTALRKWGRGE